MSRNLRIGVVAGEVSGDLLGAGLLRALKRRFGDIEIEGIGGSEMIAQGCRSLFPLEKLAVMGFTEVLGRYREIRGIQQKLIQHFRAHPPDVFIGIDAPDFNLGLEEPLRRAGIPTVHYVSPTVWAWRGYRIRRIRRAVDHMLTLFPFEADYYRRQGVPVTCVGHPMADQIPDEVDRGDYRARLKLDADATIVALLPGSRVSELEAHADLFVLTAAWLHERHPDYRFVVPLVSRETRIIFEDAIKRHEAWDLPITRMFGHGRAAMAAADIVLLASGTAATEAMLLKRLMVVTYKVSFFSQLLFRLFAHVKLYSMPNNLAGRELVPERVQRRARPEVLGQEIENLLADGVRAEEIYRVFREQHAELRRNADESAANAVLALLARRIVSGAQAARGAS